MAVQREADVAFEALTNADIEWMIDNLDGRQQIFTFTFGDKGETIHIDVNGLKELLDHEFSFVNGAEGRMLKITPELYHEILTKQGIERDRVNEITPDQAVFQPSIVVECDGGGSHIVVDGNHKIVKTYELGLTMKPAYFVPYDSIKPFLLVVPARISHFMQVCAEHNLQIQEVIKANMTPERQHAVAEMLEQTRLR